MKKILVTSKFPKEGLQALFQSYHVNYPEKEILSYEEIIAVIPEYHAVIAPNQRIDRAMIDAAKSLEIISNYGAGYDNIDVIYSTKKGILVTNTPDSVTEATAELAFGLMLSVVRRIPQWDRRVRQNNAEWGRMTNLEHTLYSKALGIIGMGRIGRAIARRAAASGMKIYYYNRNRLPPDIEKSLKAVYLPLRQLLESSDIISVNTPLTPETHHMIGREELEIMKTGVYIINTARGAIIDEQALIRYLKSGRIAGAGMDVFEHEPSISRELLEMDQVVLTPHIGTDTYETNIEMAEEAAKNIVDLFDGRVPKNIINPEVFSEKRKF